MVKKSDIFALYDEPNAKIAEKEIIEVVENFFANLRYVLRKHSDVGASDTMSRDRVIDYVEDRFRNGDW